MGELGLTGRAVGVRMPNEPETIAAWFGIWQAGCAFVPLNPRVHFLLRLIGALGSVGLERAVIRLGLGRLDERAGVQALL